MSVCQDYQQFRMFMVIKNQPDRSGWRWTVVAIGMICVSLGIGSFVVYAIAGFHQVRTGSNWPAYRLVVLSIFINTVAAWVCLKFVFKHIERRPLLTLVACDGTLRIGRVFCGAMFWLVSFATMLLVLACKTKLQTDVWPDMYARPHWPGTGNVILLVLFILTLIFAAGQEEMIIRGWWAQKIERHTKNRAITAIIICVIFAIGHGYTSLPISAGFALMSLGLSTLIAYDGRLELAMGAHAMHNVFLFVLYFTVARRDTGFHEGAGLLNKPVTWDDVVVIGGTYLLMLLLHGMRRFRRRAHRCPD